MAGGTRRAAGRRTAPPPAGHRQPAGRIQLACSNRQRVLPVRVADLKRLVTAAIRELRVPAAELSLTIVDDAEIADLHDRWLGIPGPTDVITFDLGPAASLALSTKTATISSHLNGEIIASAETARREANRYHWQPEYELAYYFVHGLLHLCGFDDRSPSLRRAMRRRERQVMEAIGLPAPPRRLPAVPRRRWATSSPSSRTP